MSDSLANVSPHHLANRFQNLIWSCLDAEFFKSAVFFAERYHVLDQRNHDARHLYALSLLKCGQVHAAMSLVKQLPGSRCPGCSAVKAQCCTALGWHSKARLALEESLTDPTGASIGMSVPLTSCQLIFIQLSVLASSSKYPNAFSQESILSCRSGDAALKSHLVEKAIPSFRHALSLNPFLWEAFEGLCAAGMKCCHSTRKLPDILCEQVHFPTWTNYFHPSKA